VRKTKEITDTLSSVLPSVMSLSAFFEKSASFQSTHFFITDKDGKPTGVFTLDDAAKAIATQPSLSLGEIANPDFITISENAPLTLVMEKLRSHNAKFILVSRDVISLSTKDIRGILPKEAIVDTLVEQSELFSSS
jgi:CBS domain-containing protein